MYSAKPSKSITSRDTVHFSDKHIFYYEGIPYKIGKAKQTTPKSPSIAIYKLDEKPTKRLTGLFNIRDNTYRGDIKTPEGKFYFEITLQDQNTLELDGFRDALIGGGYITPESKNKGFTEPYRALETLLNNEVETAENTQLSITSEPI